jgi:hypothetical protein
MYFQTLQNKVFLQGQVIDYIPKSANKTWEFNPKHNQSSAKYGIVLTEGQSLSEVCPTTLSKEWEECQKRMKAFLKSFQHVGCDPTKMNVHTIFPFELINKYFTLKQKICQHVFETFEEKENNDLMTGIYGLCSKIAEKDLNINLSNIPFHLRKKFEGVPTRVKYNPFKSVTGRLTTKKGSFPILTLKKELRGLVEPYRACFVELDFNAAELRTFLALAEQEQPEGDLHSWIAEEVFGGEFTREKSKQKTFAWFYNPEKENKALEKIFNRKKILQRWYKDGIITTPFGRKIEADQHHALNYLIQSTTSDLFMEQVLKIDKMLEGRRSDVAFTIHDSLVIDFDLEDMEITNIAGGRNFGQMKEMDI